MNYSLKLIIYQETCAQTYEEPSISRSFPYEQPVLEQKPGDETCMIRRLAAVPVATPLSARTLKPRLSLRPFWIADAKHGSTSVRWQVPSSGVGIKSLSATERLSDFIDSHITSLWLTSDITNSTWKWLAILRKVEHNQEKRFNIKYSYKIQNIIHENKHWFLILIRPEHPLKPSFGQLEIL